MRRCRAGARHAKDEDEDVSENFNNGTNDNETFQAFKMAKKSLNRQVMKKKKKKSSKD